MLVWGTSLPPFDTITEKIAKTGKEIQDKLVVTNVADLPTVATA